MAFEIVKASFEATPITCALLGKSGSGKTFSSLLLARGLVGDQGKILLIDTEGKRSNMYAGNQDIGQFDQIHLDPPYSPERYHEALETGIAAGYDAIIFDSLSHIWEGEGGVLDQADKIGEEHFKKKGRDAGFAKWNKPKSAHNRFVRRAVGCPAHVIFSIRVKRTTDMQSKQVKEVPVCEGQFEYEMVASWELEPQTHRAKIIKMPEPLRGTFKNGDVISIQAGKDLVSRMNSQSNATENPQEKKQVTEPELTQETPQEPETEENEFLALERLAEGAAKNGWKSYVAFCNTVSDKERDHLLKNGFHETFKNIANEVDASVKA